MKRLYSRALALALAITMALGLSGTAIATAPLISAPPSISVQLDGQPLAFTDATPQVRDRRTFLPFRAVFEAMGAQISNEGNVITATRDGKTLTMTIGSTEASITENGNTVPLTMDVAPYVDSATWRTYVPVRFAAQAFGCAVGWDQKAQTAVIVDTEKLVADTAAAYHYTYLERYLDYAKQFQEGNWATTGKLDGKLTLALAEGETPQELVTVAATYDGISAGDTKAQMSMNLKMDMTALLELLSAIAGPSANLTSLERAVFDTLKDEGITMDVRGDLDAGMFYVNYTGELFQFIGLTPDTWISVDLNALLAGSGMDMAALISIAKELDLKDVLVYALSMANVNDSTNAYNEVRTAVDAVFKFLADESFQKNGDNYTTSVTESVDDVSASLALTFTMRDDKVVGYGIDMGMDAAMDSTSSMVMKLSMGIDPDNKLTAVIALDVGGLGSLEINMDGAYTPTDKAPETTPPKGATIIPLEQFLSSGV